MVVVVAVVMQRLMDYPWVMADQLQWLRHRSKDLIAFLTITIFQHLWLCKPRSPLHHDSLWIVLPALVAFTGHLNLITPLTFRYDWHFTYARPICACLPCHSSYEYNRCKWFWHVNRTRRPVLSRYLSIFTKPQSLLRMPVRIRMMYRTWLRCYAWSMTFVIRGNGNWCVVWPYLRQTVRPCTSLASNSPTLCQTKFTTCVVALQKYWSRRTRWIDSDYCSVQQPIALALCLQFLNYIHSQHHQQQMQMQM